MKIEIAKNEKFETIGLKVRIGDTLVYSWGVNPDPTFNFCRRLNIQKNALTIIELIKNEASIVERRRFEREMFNVIRDSEYLTLKQGKGINIGSHLDELSQLECKRKKLIESLEL